VAPSARSARTGFVAAQAEAAGESLIDDSAEPRRDGLAFARRLAEGAPLADDVRDEQLRLSPLEDRAQSRPWRSRRRGARRGRAGPPAVAPRRARSMFGWPAITRSRISGTER
jgi:hypothetical protein